jgi:hypothetical protein
MGQAGQHYVLENFSWDRVARHIAAVDDGGEVKRPAEPASQAQPFITDN